MQSRSCIGDGSVQRWRNEEFDFSVPFARSSIGHVQPRHHARKTEIETATAPQECRLLKKQALESKPLFRRTACPLEHARAISTRLTWRKQCLGLHSRDPAPLNALRRSIRRRKVRANHEPRSPMTTETASLSPIATPLPPDSWFSTREKWCIAI